MSYINHPDKEIETKVNFFADYYLFVVSQMGLNSDFEIDNFQSLVEKIIYQLEHNFEHSNPYILSYLTHPLLQTDNKYFKELKDYESISVAYDNLREVLVKKNNDLKIISKIEILKKLKIHVINLKKYMFKNALYSIISYLVCEHDIKEHKEDLKHFTKIIAVELYFKKKGKADIKNLFQKILSRNIEVFPFPDYLKNNNHKDLNKLKAEFVENKSFSQQFEGIINYLKKPAKKNYFIFRIGNIICDDDFLFKFKDVNFYTKNHSKIAKVKKALEKKREQDDIDFFDVEFDLYVVVLQNVNQEFEDVKVALNTASEYLNHINKTCKTSGFIDKNSYLFTEDFNNVGYNISWSGTKNRLNKGNIAYLNDTNIFEFLYRKRIKSKHHFLNFEDIYIKAKTNNNTDEYWRYLENLIQKPVKTKFTKFIESELLQTQNDFIENYILNILSLWNYNSKKTSLTFEEQKALLKKIRNKDFNYDEILEKTNDEFLIDLIEYKSTLKMKNVNDYTLRILNEIYAQRNFIQHSNKIHEKTKLKLEATIPTLFMCFRSKLISNMILNPELEFEDIILKI